EAGIRDDLVTGVQTCALPILLACLSLAAGTLTAQTLAPAGVLTVGSTRVRSQSGQFSGAVVGADGTLSFGRLGLAFSYVQGKVEIGRASCRGRGQIWGGRGRS